MNSDKSVAFLGVHEEFCSKGNILMLGRWKPKEPHQKALNSQFFLLLAPEMGEFVRKSKIRGFEVWALE